MESNQHKILFCVFLIIALHARCFSSGMFENVALNKPCNMSSQKDPEPDCRGAVNGDTTGDYDPGGTNCIHTAGDDFTPWWEVNLGRPYPVHSITVFARTDGENFLSRMEGVEISVDGKECYRFNSTPPDNIVINCTSGVVNGTVIRFYKNATGLESPKNLINLCEIQVLSCSDSYWGIDCKRKCGHCSNGEVCDKVTGHCPSCSPGWTPPFCDEVAEDDDLNTFWVIVGASLGAVGLLAAVLVVVLVSFRLRQSRPHPPTEPNNHEGQPETRDSPPAGHVERQDSAQRPQSQESEHSYDYLHVPPPPLYDRLQPSQDPDRVYSVLDNVQHS